MPPPHGSSWRVTAALVFALAGCTDAAPGPKDFEPIAEKQLLGEGQSGRWRWRLMGWPAPDGLCIRVRSQPGQSGGSCIGHDELRLAADPVTTLTSYDFAGPKTMLTMFADRRVESVDGIDETGLRVPLRVVGLGSPAEVRVVFAALHDRTRLDTLEFLATDGAVMGSIVCSGLGAGGFESVLPGGGCTYREAPAARPTA